MKKILVFCMICFFTTTLFAGKGKIGISTDIKSGYIYIDGKKKAMVGDGFTNLLLEEGEYTVKIKYSSADGEWIYKGTKKIFVGEDSSTNITINTSKIATQKRKDRLEIQKKEKDIRVAKEKKERDIRVAKKKKAWQKLKNKVINHDGFSYKMIKSPYTKKSG